ncbi:hypothetical protein MF271_22350 (plasmid) [Deinococcus sp. KNUC1210]|uniref:hypothetical protein n=1 Tax=Deinococcus sp. KNUC1210 TaxID=2917691 RepID=UPI001EEFD413|nr:hypothetical protein [Deinococcus sp. KNUC1210]ULH18214.1 hypothetical protein MF271_22350 [Deinococcus sp. KNUC1210]
MSGRVAQNCVSPGVDQVLQFRFGGARQPHVHGVDLSKILGLGVAPFLIGLLYWQRHEHQRATGGLVEPCMRHHCYVLCSIMVFVDALSKQRPAHNMQQSSEGSQQDVQDPFFQEVNGVSLRQPDGSWLPSSNQT